MEWFWVHSDSDSSSDDYDVAPWTTDYEELGANAPEQVGGNANAPEQGGSLLEERGGNLGVPPVPNDLLHIQARR